MVCAAGAVNAFLLCWVFFVKMACVTHHVHCVIGTGNVGDASGFYCPAASAAATLCPLGFWCGAVMAVPVPCAAGYYGNATGMGFFSSLFLFFEAI